METPEKPILKYQSFFQKLFGACSANPWSPLSIDLICLSLCFFASLFPLWRSTCFLSSMYFILFLPSHISKIIKQINKTKQNFLASQFHLLLKF